MSSARRSAAAALRNRGPILEVLRAALPRHEDTFVLEVGSGTGEHAVWFARELPHVIWQPSDPSAEARASIGAWADEAGLKNLRPPLALDVTTPAERWPVAAASLDALVSINLIHIAPWEATEGLCAGAGRVLERGGLLCLYGPFNVGGRFTAPSNERFDASLRARDPRWGVRDLEAVEALARRFGLMIEQRVAMPANNLTLLFRRGLDGAQAVVNDRASPRRGREGRANGAGGA